MDRECPSDYVEKTEESLPHTEEVIEHIRSLPPSKGAFRGIASRFSHPGNSADGSPYVYPVLTPRFAISATDELLEKLGGFADSNPSLAIQTHISENPSEVKYTNQLFSHLSEPGKPITYAGVYDHYRLLRKNTILAHAVHLQEEELNLVKERDSGISHCPTSNFNLTSGVAKVGVLLDRNIKAGSSISDNLP
jgi:guanine deaminase